MLRSPGVTQLLLKRANHQPLSPLKVFKNRLLISPSLLRADTYVAIAGERRPSARFPGVDLGGRASSHSSFSALSAGERTLM